MSTKPSMQNSNVFKKPLGLFSKQPMTGYFRDGYCRTTPEDTGNHAVAGVVTDEFLDFSASRGNNLRSIGLKAGNKWCLCAGRWKEAMDAAKSASDPVVPKVYLHATHESALKSITLEQLKKYAADGETTGAVSGTNPRGMAGPAEHKDVRETSELSKEGMATSGQTIPIAPGAGGKGAE